MAEPNQVDYADLLADILNASDDYNITGLDLLDALASAGLKLVSDEVGDSTIAYQTQIEDRLEGR